MLRVLCVVVTIMLSWKARALAGSQATATASITAGLVSEVTVTDGGSGYQLPPGVSFSGGGGGVGATAVAILDGDKVAAVIVTTAGNGYTSIPSVTIDPPPALVEQAKLSIDTVPRITIIGAPGSTNAIEWAEGVGDPTVWHPLTNVVLGATPSVLIDSTVLPGGRRIYRVISTNGEPPGRPQGFVWIRPGSFVMGSLPTEVGRQTDEIVHNVTLTRGFWISDHETTASEYGQILKLNPGGATDPNLPVVQVSWSDATNYCAQLTTSESNAGRLPPGFRYRLPTEAEWEYACRAGTTTAYFVGDDPAGLQAIAWFRENSGSEMRLIRQKQPNPWGLYDMAGNVSEWCADSYDTYPIWDVQDPTGKPTGFIRVVRGGYAVSAASECRSAARNQYHQTTAQSGLGFRPVLAPAQ